MPFSLKNAPASFMDPMNSVFYDYLDEFVIVFVDDFFIYIDNEKLHEEHLRKTLETHHSKYITHPSITKMYQNIKRMYLVARNEKKCS